LIRLRRNADEVSSELRRLARAQPQWVANAEAERCMLCPPAGAPPPLFWAVGPPRYTRHHCRCCGWVVCLGCLPRGQTVELDRWVSSTVGHPLKQGRPTKAKRVCNSCAEWAPAEVAAVRPPELAEPAEPPTHPPQPPKWMMMMMMVVVMVDRL
jgi:hypothetical protein